MTFLMPKASKPRPAPPPPPVVTQPPPPVPTRAEPEVAEARDTENLRMATLRRRGRRSTILTSPLGATDVPNVERRAALGNVAV